MRPVSQDILDIFAHTTVQVLHGFMTQAMPRFDWPHDQLPSGDISTLIKLTEDNVGLEIMLVLYFSEPAANTIYSNLFGIEAPGGIRDVCSLLAEIANVVAGNVKGNLSGSHGRILEIFEAKSAVPIADDSLHFEMDLPTTVIGDGHHIFGLIKGGSTRSTIPFWSKDELLLTLDLTFQRE